MTSNEREPTFSERIAAWARRSPQVEPAAAGSPADVERKPDYLRAMNIFSRSPRMICPG